MTILEQVIETVRQWPPAERRRLRDRETKPSNNKSNASAKQ